jgi:hypothetical protein
MEVMLFLLCHPQEYLLMMFLIMIFSLFALSDIDLSEVLKNTMYIRFGILVEPLLDHSIQFVKEIINLKKKSGDP